MIGETYFMQKHYNQAIRAYHRVEGLYDYPRWKAAALLQAGKCHEMVGRWTEATELYAEIVKDYSETRFSDQGCQATESRTATSGLDEHALNRGR